MTLIPAYRRGSEFRRRSDGCVTVPLSLKFCSAFDGSRSTTRRMNLRNTLFGGLSKSTSRNPRIQPPQLCRTERFPPFTCEFGNPETKCLLKCCTLRAAVDVFDECRRCIH
jgi:hypothetical protein